MQQDVIWDSVPTMRTKKEEKFSFPVVTISALDKVGAGRKFSFNKAAQDLLQIEGEDRISFGFTPDGEHIYLKKAVAPAGFKLTKTCTFSDKKTFEFITKRLSLNTDFENNFEVISTSIGESVFEMVTLGDCFDKAVEVTEFKQMELGVISDKPSMEADLSSIPETPEGGVVYQEERGNISEIIDEEMEDSDDSLATTSMMIDEDLTSPTSEDDSWN